MKERQIKRYLRYDLFETVDTKSLENAGDAKDILNVLRDNIPFLKEFNKGPSISITNNMEKKRVRITWAKTKNIIYLDNFPMVLKITMNYIQDGMHYSDYKTEEDVINRYIDIEPRLFRDDDDDKEDEKMKNGTLFEINDELREKYEKTFKMEDDEQEFFNEVNKAIFELFEEYDPAS